MLALCGMSPAVISETVYCLRDNLPDEVIVITTNQGYLRINEELFEAGAWHRLTTAICGYKRVKFSNNPHHIRLIPAVNGVADDIVSDCDNALMADFILGNLRQFTENQDTKITFSIAGGRKTMSSIAALAMGLLGRQHDDLCHVLVNPPFDSPQLFPRFYFPEIGTFHKLPGGDMISSDSARLSLCRIPYVRQRYLFTDRLNRLPGDYVDMVRLANSLIGDPHDLEMLELIPGTCSCRIGENVIRFSATEFSLLWLWAVRLKERKPLLKGLLNLQEELCDFIETRASRELMPELLANREDLLAKSPDALRRPVSALKKKFTDTLGRVEAEKYLSFETACYGLLADHKLIDCPMV